MDSWEDIFEDPMMGVENLEVQELSEEHEEQYDAHIQCRDCFGWTFVKGSQKRFFSIHGYTSGRKCSHCQSENFDPQSVTSSRTFNPLTAKKRKPRGFRKKK